MAAAIPDEAALPAIVRQRVLSMAGALTDVRSEADARRALAAAAQEFSRADDAVCVFADGDSGLLWSADSQWSADEGIVGACARTRVVIDADRADADPRWCAAVDEQACSPADRLLAVPLVGGDGEVHAVLVASRAPARDAFDEASRAELLAYCHRAGPMLEHFLDVVAVGQTVLPPSSVYRAEAIEAMDRPIQGRAVSITPPWLGVTFWLIAGVVATGIAFLCVASKHHYSSGPAIVRDGRKCAVVSRQTGTVHSINVDIGQRVHAGELLAVLDHAALRDELLRLENELDARVREHLLEPDSSASAEVVGDLQQRVLATRTRLKEREIRAPLEGVVVDVRAQNGRPVAIGDVVATLDTGEGSLQLLALLPGHDRPALSPGMQMRLEIPGYRHDYQPFPIVSIEDAAVSPREIARLLGSEHADSIALVGPTVVVRAQLPEDFVIDGRSYAYHDGMFGTAEVRLEREPLIFVLLPFLAEVFR